jgi:glycosyltransferase involved in cell wall biosynthesis
MSTDLPAGLVNDMVSVITVSRDSAPFIEQTLSSVMEQTYAPIEHIVIDCCSTDGTRDILKRYAGRYSMRWVSEPDRGQSHAFNKGVLASMGRWLYLLNADDYLVDPGAIGRVMSWIAGHTGYSIYMGRILSVDERGVVDHAAPTGLKYAVYSHDVLLNQEGMVVHQGTFYDRKIFADAGLYSEKYRIAMDYEFHLRVTRFCDIAAMDLDVACLRRHAGAKSQQPSARRYFEFLRARLTNGGGLLHHHNAHFVRGLLRAWPPTAYAARQVGKTRAGRALITRSQWGRRGLR